MAAIKKYVPVAIGIKGGVVSAFEPGSVKLSPALQRELYRAGGPRPKQAVVLGADPVTEFSVPDIMLFTGLAALSVGEPGNAAFARLDDARGFSTTHLPIACTSGQGKGRVHGIWPESSRGQLGSIPPLPPGAVPTGKEPFKATSTSHPWQERTRRLQVHFRQGSTSRPVPWTGQGVGGFLATCRQGPVPRPG